jgi:3-hydroxyisobutyrate dehydrogenase-like beta-hydroxyacid dehydrogenase
MNKAIGFIGLGIMGFPMAGHLSKQHNVFVFNRSKEKTKSWIKKYSGTECSSIKEISQLSDILFICVGNDKDVREIISEKDGALEYLKSGSSIVDHTTTSADLAIEMNNLLSSKNINYLDAPVSGGQAGAESGQLSIMVGGRDKSYDEIKDLIKTYSKFSKHMGKSGAGQLTKMVNQICIAGLLQGLAEGINFSEKVGLDSSDVLEVVSKGAAQSWQMENRWHTMLEDKFDHGFAVDLMRKDLEIVIKKAQDENITIDVTKIVNDYYKEIQKAKGGKWDTSSLYKRLKDNL